MRPETTGEAVDQPLAQYIENVFRLQNTLTSEVMMRVASDTEQADTIVQAEQRMQQACKPLNEYATQESDGLRIGLALQLKAKASAAHCEKAAKFLQSALVGN